MSGPVVEKPQLTRNGKIILCSTENFVPTVVPGLATGSSSSSASSSRNRSRDPAKTKNQNEDNVEVSRNRLRDLPEWSEEFTESLEDKELPAS